MTSSLINWELTENKSPSSFHGQLFISVIFEARMLNIAWFQLIKYKDLLLFFTGNEESLGFGLLVGQKSNLKM